MSVAVQDPDYAWMFGSDDDEESLMAAKSSSVQKKPPADPLGDLVGDTVLACTNWFDTQVKSFMDERQQREQTQGQEQQPQNPLTEAVTAFMTWLDTDDPEWGFLFENAYDKDMQQSRADVAAAALVEKDRMSTRRMLQRQLLQKQRSIKSRHQFSASLSQLPENEELVTSISAPEITSQRDERYDPPTLAAQLSSIWVVPGKAAPQPQTQRSRSRRRVCRQRKSEKCGKLSVRAFMAVAQECSHQRSHSLPAKLPAALPLFLSGGTTHAVLANTL